MNVTIIDLETTGLDPEKDKVIEIGAILYSIKYQTVLSQFSTLFPTQENPQESTNKIKPESTQFWDDGFKNERQALINKNLSFMLDTGIAVAHNAKFEKQWLSDKWPDVKWLCTYEDFIWPNNPKPTNLINTCLNHGVAVTKAHRALTDCQLIAELFDRANDLQGLFDVAIARSNEPLLTITACVNYENKELARQAGFYWEPAKKYWFKQLRESDLIKESKSWGFEYHVNA